MQIVYAVLVILSFPYILFASNIKDTISYSLDLYADNVGVFIFSPVATFQKKLNERFAYIASLRIDGISAASIRNAGGSGTNYVIADAVSGASGRLGFQDLRVAPTLNVLYEESIINANMGTYISNEVDFNAISGFGDIALKLNSDNTIISLGGSYTYEIWNPSISRSLAQKDKRSWGVTSSLTQLITPRSYAQARYSYNSSSGYLASPYQVLVTSTFTQYDRYPLIRNAHAFALQYVHEVLEGWAVHGQYRFYTDSWQQGSHTFELKNFYDVNDYLTLSLRGRYYTQSATYFTKKISEYKYNDDYIVSNYRLSALGTYTFGMGSSYRPEALEDKNLLINASINYYMTDKNNYIEAWYKEASIFALYMSVGVSYDF